MQSRSHPFFHPLSLPTECRWWGTSLGHEAESSTGGMAGAPGQEEPDLCHHGESHYPSLGLATGRLL